MFTKRFERWQKSPQHPARILHGWTFRNQKWTKKAISLGQTQPIHLRSVGGLAERQPCAHVNKLTLRPACLSILGLYTNTVLSYCIISTQISRMGPTVLACNWPLNSSSYPRGMGNGYRPSEAVLWLAWHLPYVTRRGSRHLRYCTRHGLFYLNLADHQGSCCAVHRYHALKLSGSRLASSYPQQKARGKNNVRYSNWREWCAANTSISTTARRCCNAV